MEFVRKKILIRHLRIHFGELRSLQQTSASPKRAGQPCWPFTNSYRGKKSPSNATTVQNRMAYTGERHYACPLSPSKFAKKSIFNQHMFVHSGKRSFNCPDCFVGFTRLEGLKQHSRIHTKWEAIRLRQTLQTQGKSHCPFTNSFRREAFVMCRVLHEIHVAGNSLQVLQNTI